MSESPDNAKETRETEASAATGEGNNQHRIFHAGAPDDPKHGQGICVQCRAIVHYLGAFGTTWVDEKGRSHTKHEIELLPLTQSEMQVLQIRASWTVGTPAVTDRIVNFPLLQSSEEGTPIWNWALLKDEVKTANPEVLQKEVPREILQDFGIDPIEMERELTKRLLDYKKPWLPIAREMRSAQDEAKQAEEYFEQGKFIAKRLGDELIKTYQVRTTTDTKEMYLYQDGVWEPVGESLIHAEVQKRLAEKTAAHYVNETLTYIRGETYIERKMFNADVNLLNLKNGVYDIEKGQLLPHSPTYMFTHRLPLTYDSAATCPKIEKFLQDIQPNETQRKGLLELIGYCLYRAYPIQNAFLAVGDGANGKSTFIDLVKRFLGASNTASVSLHELEEQRFTKAILYDKHANLFPDLPSRALNQTGTFKMLTGGDQITADKKFRDDFNFVNYAKMIFSANQVPRSAVDDSDAFYRRWVIYNFPNKFEGEKADLTIIDKVSTQEELSGLLNLALKALEELLARGRFVNDTDTDTKREQYIRLSDPVRSFVMDSVDSSPDDFVKKDVAYEAFCEYCHRNNYPDLSKVSFDKRFRTAVEVQDYRPEIGGVRVYAWKGIKLRSDEAVAKDGQAKLL
jgi:P4 family phage/plasmid primase-like protien